MSNNLPANRPQSAPPQAPSVASATASAFRIDPSTYKQMMEFADFLSKSSLIPKQYQGKGADIIVAVMWGEELGIKPMQALRGMAVINGRATIWGDLGVALVRRSKQLEYMIPGWDEMKKTMTVRMKRRGQPEHVETFGLADAQKVPYKEWDYDKKCYKAGINCLADKDTYKAWLKRMCFWRAATFGMRFLFPDVLNGLEFAEDVESIPAEVPNMGNAATPISMPRRVGEAPPAIEQAPAAPAPPPDYEGVRQAQNLESGTVTHEPAPIPEDPPPPAEPEAVNQDPGPAPILVTEIEQKSYTKTVIKTNEKVTKPYWLVKFSDGIVASTFSDTTFDKATKALTEQIPVVYTAKPGKTEGAWNLETFELVPQ